MNLSVELNDALNAQIGHEYRNASYYMQMASLFENRQLKNLAKLFVSQAQGERAHGDSIVDHINARLGGVVSIPEIEAPVGLSDDPVSIGLKFVEIEKATTESIEDIYRMVLDTGSYIDIPFITGLLNEQVEEEDLAIEFSDRISSVKDIVLFDATFEK